MTNLHQTPFHASGVYSKKTIKKSSAGVLKFGTNYSEIEIEITPCYCPFNHSGSSSSVMIEKQNFMHKPGTIRPKSAQFQLNTMMISPTRFEGLLRPLPRQVYKYKACAIGWNDDILTHPLKRFSVSQGADSQSTFDPSIGYGKRTDEVWTRTLSFKQDSKPNMTSPSALF